MSKTMRNKKLYWGMSLLLIALLVFSIFNFTHQGNVDSSVSNDKSSGPVTTFVKLVKNILEDGNKERTFMVLLQNNMELRPGGGFIGSFAIIKTRGEKVLSYEIHDTGNFDGRIPDTQPMPYPMKEIFGIDAWKFRDSNYSPDFKTNAEKALEFYYLGEGREEFDGIFAINVALLEKILEFIGPINLEGFPDTYTSENVLITLEKQVEMDFWRQGIDRGDRKQVIGVFLKEILSRVNDLSIIDKAKLFKILTGELENKNIQLYFNDQELQGIVREANWAGEIDRSWAGDYLMMVDANLGAYKSDYYIRRSADYSVDFSGVKPRVILKIKYNHTAEEENWFTKDYQSYLRVYVPKGAQLESFGDVKEPKIGNDFDKTYFGGLIQIETKKEKIIEIIYTLPEKITYEEYDLKIQKQSGVSNVPVKVNIKSGDGQSKKFDIIMDEDVVLKK